MRLINADALKENIKRYASSNWVIPCDEVLNRIENSPTVVIPNYGGQVVPDNLQGWRYEERPKGEWKLYGMIYYCSNCGHDCGESGDNFCGNCGADMRGDQP